MATYWHGQAWDTPPPRLTQREAAKSCYWSMWQRRRAPYGALGPGDRVLVVDTFRRERTVAWEYEVLDVSHEPHRSLAEAARTISRGVGAASGLAAQAVRAHPYTRTAPSAGYLVAWRGRPVRAWYRPLPAEVRLARHGYTNVSDEELQRLGFGSRPAHGRTRRSARVSTTQGQEADPQRRQEIEQHAIKPAEVNFARDHQGAMILYVLHRITAEQESHGKLRCSGGTPHVEDPLGARRPTADGGHLAIRPTSDPMMPPADPRERTRCILASLVPRGRPFEIRIPLAEDECHWFSVAVDTRLFRFEDCPQGCPRLRKWKVAGPDHFVTRAGMPRHIFTAPHALTPTLNREYLPHIAAYARAIHEYGYDPAHSSFSRYRTFGRDLILKRARQSYETDAEFYDPTASSTCMSRLRLTLVRSLAWQHSWTEQRV